MSSPEQIQREPREKEIKIKFGDVFLPGLAIGGIIFYYVYKDEITKFIEKIPWENLDKLKIPIYPLPPINIPRPGGGGGNIPITNPVDVSGFGGGSVSFHTLASGGSAWRKEWQVPRRYLNVEFRGYFFIPRGNNGIQIKVRGGRHTDSAKNEGCCIIFYLPFNGSNRNNFQKECPHPEYSKNTVGTQFSPGSIIGKWVGARCVAVNQGNGVRCQMWLDTSGRPGANQWRLWYDILDTGQYGGGQQSPPFTRSPMYGNNPRVIVRIDADTQSEAQGYQMNYASVGEVASSNLAQSYSYLNRITVV